MVILLSFVNAACCMACNGSEKNYWSLNFKWWKWEWVSWETNDLLFVWLSIKVECSIFCLDGSTCVYDSPCFICNISLTPFLLIPYATLLLLLTIARFLSCYLALKRRSSVMNYKEYLIFGNSNFIWTRLTLMNQIIPNIS